MNLLLLCIFVSYLSSWTYLTFDDPTVSYLLNIPIQISISSSSFVTPIEKPKLKRGRGLSRCSEFISRKRQNCKNRAAYSTSTKLNDNDAEQCETGTSDSETDENGSDDSEPKRTEVRTSRVLPPI